MIEFGATYFDGKDAGAHEVRVRVDGGLLRISEPGGPLAVDFPLAGCQITPPLGRTRRSLTLPGGARCETDDHEAVAALEKRRGKNIVLRFVHRLESSWRLVVACLAGVVLGGWLFVSHGIPLLAEKVACSVPVSLLELISSQTTKILDERFLQPSDLDQQRAAELRALFNDLVSGSRTGFAYRLEFRRSSILGPNAIALPSGLVLMTDELVGIARSDKELAAVLVHEIAHVDRRHGMRSLLQSTGVFMLVATMAGDIASLSSMAAALPAILIESGYSRNFEREADDIAGKYFTSRGWSTVPFQDILLRIAEKMPDFPGGAFLASHPETGERVRHLKELEEKNADR